MILERLMTPTTIEMFSPAATRSVTTNLQLARLRERFFGRDWMSAVQAVTSDSDLPRSMIQQLRDGDDLPDKIIREIDKRTLEVIKNFYRLPEGCDPREYYIRQHKDAIQIERHLSVELPELAADLDPKNEMSILSDSPYILMKFLYMSPEKIDPVLAYEAHRRSLLLTICGRNNSMHVNERSLSFLATLLAHFNRFLFEGPLGAGKNIYLKSIHDDETNKVVGFPDEGQQIVPATHLKRIKLTVRSIGGTPVLTSTRKKNDSRAVWKSIAEAQETGGEITTDPLKDRLGMMIVPMEPGVDPTSVADMVISSMESGVNFDGNVIRIARIDNERAVGRTRGQAANFAFDERRIIWFENFSVPLELAVLSRGNYLDSVLEVGEKDSETQLYTGKSHRLYGLRRDTKVAPTIHPNAVYDIDFSPFFIKKSEAISKELRGFHRKD